MRKLTNNINYKVSVLLISEVKKLLYTDDQSSHRPSQKLLHVLAGRVIFSARGFFVFDGIAYTDRLVPSRFDPSSLRIDKPLLA